MGGTKAQKRPHSSTNTGKSESGQELDADQITRYILCMIVQANLPLSFVDNYIFRSFMKHILPWYVVPTRRTLTRLLEEAFTFAKKQYALATKEQPFFSTTFDLATVTNSARHFLVVTVHYYDQEASEFESLTIGAVQMLKRSTGDEINECLTATFEDFGIETSKVGAACTDGGSNVKKAGRDMFGISRQITCHCHTLDNVIKAGLKEVPTLKSELSNLKSIVTFFKQSYVAANKLRQLQVDKSNIKWSKSEMLKQSVCTRWNTVLEAIQKFIKLYEFVKVVLQDKDINVKNHQIADDAVNSLEELIPLFQQFKELTVKFSSNSTVLSSTVNLDIMRLLCHLKSLNTTGMAQDLQKYLIKELEERFEDSWNSPILAAAYILDPRFKGSLHGNFDRDRFQKGAEYIKAMVVARNTNGQQAQPKEQNALLEFMSTLKSTQPLMPNEEIHCYLDSPYIDMALCPLDWWNSNKNKYPNLSAIAMALLTIPVSSVAAERTVSTLNRVLSNKRTRLNVDNVNRLVVLTSMPLKYWKLYVGVENF